MCCEQHQHRHHRGGCCDDMPEWAERRARRWGASFPPPWAGSGYGWEFGPMWQPGKAERKEWLEALKKHLEARLADVNEELGKL
jgi:hypothetical protein